jgi:hypothetical protein
MRRLREILRLKVVGGVPTRRSPVGSEMAASTVLATLKRFQAPA